MTKTKLIQYIVASGSVGPETIANTLIAAGLPIDPEPVKEKRAGEKIVRDIWQHGSEMNMYEAIAAIDQAIADAKAEGAAEQRKRDAEIAQRSSGGGHDDMYSRGWRQASEAIREEIEKGQP